MSTDEAAERVDALAEWYRETCELAQLNQTDTAPFQYPLSRFVLLHGTVQWTETKAIFRQQGLL